MVAGDTCARLLGRAVFHHVGVKRDVSQGWKSRTTLSVILKDGGYTVATNQGTVGQRPCWPDGRRVVRHVPPWWFCEERKKNLVEATRRDSVTQGASCERPTVDSTDRLRQYCLTLRRYRIIGLENATMRVRSTWLNLLLIWAVRIALRKRYAKNTTSRGIIDKNERKHKKKRIEKTYISPWSCSIVVHANGVHRRFSTNTHLLLRETSVKRFRRHANTILKTTET